MSGTSPAYDFRGRLPALTVYEIACMLAGFDPRAMTDAVNSAGDHLDLSEEITLITSAVLFGEIQLAPSESIGGLSPKQVRSCEKASCLGYGQTIMNRSQQGCATNPSRPQKVKNSSVARALPYCFKKIARTFRARFPQPVPAGLRWKPRGNLSVNPDAVRTQGKSSSAWPDGLNPATSTPTF